MDGKIHQIADVPNFEVGTKNLLMIEESKYPLMSDPSETDPLL